MKTPRSKSKTNTKHAAVAVSFRLQYAVVAAAVITWAIESIYTIARIGQYQQFGLDHLSFVMLSGSLFPLVLFGVFLLSTPRFAQPISSLFIAILKTILALMLFWVLVSVKNWLVSLSYGQIYPVNDGLRWMLSPGVDFGLMAITLFCVLWFIRENAQKKA